MDDFFHIYDTLISQVDVSPISSTMSGCHWTAVETAGGFGTAMTTEGNTIPTLLSGKYEGMPLRQLAQAAKSWNLREASFGMAAINAFFNTPKRLKQLGSYEPFDRYCTAGLDLQGKHIGVVGHLNMPAFLREQAASVRILERCPRPGDYPDSACEWLLPQCDIVLITASTLTNKTLPHLLQLCKNAYTILIGPSCPMCPALLECGIDRLAGLVITDISGMKAKIRGHLPGSPYSLGLPFLLTKQDL